MALRSTQDSRLSALVNGPMFCDTFDRQKKHGTGMGGNGGAGTRVEHGGR